MEYVPVSTRWSRGRAQAASATARLAASRRGEGARLCGVGRRAALRKCGGVNGDVKSGRGGGDGWTRA
eukprot:3049669-Prymnesium_polylepis.1